MGNASYCLYFDTPDFYDYKRVQARKPHTCTECKTTIQPGKHYHRFTSVFDRVWITDKLCWKCYEIWKWANDHGMCIGIGNIYDQLAESEVDFEYGLICGKEVAMRELTKSGLGPEAAEHLITRFELMGMLVNLDDCDD